MAKNIHTVEEFETLLKENNKLVIDFYADWCGPCKQLLPVIEDLSDEINVYKIDVDEVGTLEISKRFTVRSIPHLLFFKDGDLATKTTGYQTKEQILTTYNNL